MPRHLLDSAVGICRELGPGVKRFLVNSDQHYQNVLAGDREPWLVIDRMFSRVTGNLDSQPCAGDVWTKQLHKGSWILIDVEDLDAAKAHAWTFVDAVAKWVSQPQGRWAKDCATIAHELLPARPILSTRSDPEAPRASAG